MFWNYCIFASHVVAREQQYIIAGGRVEKSVCGRMDRAPAAETAEPVLISGRFIPKALIDIRSFTVWYSATNKASLNLLNVW